MNERIESYRDLRVWQSSMELVTDCYKATESFPKAETYGLSSQLQRAAVSIPANIAEGKGRYHLKEYLHHLSMAHGSLLELETLLEIAGRLGYLGSKDAAVFRERTEGVGKMLNGLMASLRRPRTPDTGHRENPFHRTPPAAGTNGRRGPRHRRSRRQGGIGGARGTSPRALRPHEW